MHQAGPSPRFIFSFEYLRFTERVLKGKSEAAGCRLESRQTVANQSTKYHESNNAIPNDTFLFVGSSPVRPARHGAIGQRDQ